MGFQQKTTISLHRNNTGCFYWRCKTTFDCDLVGLDFEMIEAIFLFDNDKHVKLYQFMFQLVVQWTLVEGVRRQFDAVREGFDLIFSLSSLSLFSADEVII